MEHVTKPDQGNAAQWHPGEAVGISRCQTLKNFVWSVNATSSPQKQGGPT